MPLSNADWTEILDHTRRRVREVGFADVDDRVTIDFQTTDQASADFIRYLSAVSSSLTERSYSGYAKALHALREGLDVEGTDGVQGIEVIFSEADARLYGTDRMDLQTAENLEPMIRELGSIEDYLAKNGLLDE